MKLSKFEKAGEIQDSKQETLEYLQTIKDALVELKKHRSEMVYLEDSVVPVPFEKEFLIGCFCGQIERYEVKLKRLEADFMDL